MLIGVVGLANMGKSTFFKAATLMDVEIANYPFATIKPNHGVGFVRVPCIDKEFNTQCNPRTGFCRNHERFIPVEMIDVAGLVPGAHEGKGMGLEFLNDLNQADALIHVIDLSGSTTANGEPTDRNSQDPCMYIKHLEDELDHWYLTILKKPWEKFSRAASQTNENMTKALHKQFSGLGSDEDMIKRLLNETQLQDKKLSDWTEDDLFSFAKALRKATKPMIVAANKIDVPGAAENLDKLRKTFPDTTFVGCSAESELALREADRHHLIEYMPGDSSFVTNGNLNDQQKKGLDFISENVLKKHGSTGVQEVLNKTVFDILQMIAVWPGGVSKLEDQFGNILPDCFLLPKGSTALDFANKVHTDFGKNFIRAIDVRTKKTVGKDHVISHRDVIEIITSK